MKIRARGAQATINQQHLRHNVTTFKGMHRGPLVAVVKADAYGHGIEHVVPALGEVDAFAVATIDEAMQLRKLCHDQRIILLEGVFNDAELQLALSQNFDVVVHQKYQLALLDQLKTSDRLSVWLKVDTGMNRLGFELNFVKNTIEPLKNNPAISLHVMSHFAQSDQPLAMQTQQQLTANEWLSKLGLPFSFSNTAAVLSGISHPQEWVRVGLGLFGISPTEDSTAADFKLRPVMNLQSRVIATKSIQKGQTVGYGAHFVAQKPIRLAIVGIGYADGYPWSHSQSTHVMLNGLVCPVVGRVSMDMLAIDVSAQPETEPGDVVQLWGDVLPVERLAKQLDVIPYALVCGITKRVKFDVIQ